MVKLVLLDMYLIIFKKEMILIYILFWFDMGRVEIEFILIFEVGSRFFYCEVIFYLLLRVYC